MKLKRPNPNSQKGKSNKEGFARLQALQKKAKQQSMARLGFVSFKDLTDGKALFFPLDGSLGEREYKVKSKTYKAYPFLVDRFILVDRHGKVVKQGKVKDGNFNVNGKRGEHYFEMPTNMYSQKILEDITDTSCYLMLSDYQGQVGENNAHMFDTLILQPDDPIILDLFKE